MADSFLTLRRMLDGGKLTEEQCRSILRGLYIDKEAGGSTSEIKGIVEKKVELDRPKTLLELLDYRKVSDEEPDVVCGQLYDSDEEDITSYSHQYSESQGFDIEPDTYIPHLNGIKPFYFGENDEQPPAEMVLYGRLGVHWFNFINENRNLKFIRIPKLNTEHVLSRSYYISVEVKDVDAAAADSLTLQTMVSRPVFPKSEIYIYYCRIKPTPTTGANCHHDEFTFFQSDGINEFYRGCMPTFVSQPPEEEADHEQVYGRRKEESDEVVYSGRRFYQVQQKDINENDWLRLYTEFALFQVCEAGSHPFLPDEMVIKNILVETFETHTEPSLKLQSKNAIFHISFRANSCDYTSVVRRTSDGRHLFLEVDSHKETIDCFSRQVPSRT